MNGTNGHKITLFIADPCPEVRERLRALVGEFPELELVGEAADAIQATARILKQKPDVAILDARMPGGSGADVMGHVHQHHLSTIGVILLHRNLPGATSSQPVHDTGPGGFRESYPGESEDFSKLRHVLSEWSESPEATEV